MNELKITKIIIAISLILIIVGGLALWQKGWIEKEFSLASIFESGVKKTEQISFLTILPKLAGFGEERNYLLLFQNNLELRPSGGYLGNFGIVKVKNAQVVSFETHDTNIFDGFGKVQTEPPKPLKDYLHVENWQMRDSNWSPDWPIASQQIEYFYRLQGGKENFDGIIAVNAAVLPNLLELIGPVYLEKFDREFVAESVLYELEYEVERGYIARGIEAGERKMVFKMLVGEILEKITEEDFWKKNNLKSLIFNELAQKNILLFFKNSEEQGIINKLGWGGQIDQSHQDDYLMIVEANLGGRKSNAFIERNVEYTVDLSKDAPVANLKIKYTHTNGEKDWFNHDYRAFLRIYAPYKSWLSDAYGTEDKTMFLDELGKTVFGNWIIVPAGGEKIIEFSYILPAHLKDESVYRLLVQKQSGMNNLPFKFILKKDGREEIREKNIIKGSWEGVIDQ